MVYSATTWMAGDVITAVGLNNLETQYAKVKTDYYLRYTTHSTASTLMKVTSTISSTFGGGGANNSEIKVFNILVPQYVLPSRCIFSVDMKVASTTVTEGVILTRSDLTPVLYTEAPYVLFLQSSYSTTYQTFTTEFNIVPGVYHVSHCAPSGAGGTVSMTNISICGTTTASTETIDNWFDFSLSNITATPTSTG